MVWKQVAECWFREYQVLPARTHPHMSMSGSGGYMLTGIKIINTAGAPISTDNMDNNVTSVDTTDDTDTTASTPSAGADRGGKGKGNKWLRDRKKRPRK
jgi:hypothetical protein